jgi:hypothetical protein
MKKTSLIGSVVLALMASEGAWAGESVAGKTFNLTGKFGGSAKVSCRVGGAHGQRFKAQKNLAATIAFNEDGTFEWSNDALQIGQSATGEWEQAGSKIDLLFDDPNSMSYLRLFGNQQVSAQSQGASVTGDFEPARYDFFARTNSKATSLVVTEKGGFKLNADASSGGSSNSCKYKINLNRVYKGKSE